MNKIELKQLIKECLNESYLEENDLKYIATDGKLYTLHVEEDKEYRDGVVENVKNFHYIKFPNGKSEYLDLSPYTDGGREFVLWVELYIKTKGKFPLKNPNGGNWDYKDLKTLADKLNIKTLKEWGMPVETANKVDINKLDIEDLEKLLANPDPERAKDYGSIEKYKLMIQKKIASLKSGKVNETIGGYKCSKCKKELNKRPDYNDESGNSLCDKCAGQ